MSSLVENADIALSLHIYILTVRIPLAAAQVQHLDSSECLVFGFAPLLRIAKKRFWHFVSFSLRTTSKHLKNVLQFCRRSRHPLTSQRPVSRRHMAKKHCRWTEEVIRFTRVLRQKSSVRTSLSLKNESAEVFGAHSDLSSLQQWQIDLESWQKSCGVSQLLRPYCSWSSLAAEKITGLRFSPMADLINARTAHSLPVPTPASCGVHDCAAPWRLAASVSASHASGAPASPIHLFGCQLENRCGARTCS